VKNLFFIPLIRRLWRHLLPQGEKERATCASDYSLLPLWEKVSKGRMRGIKKVLLYIVLLLLTLLIQPTFAVEPNEVMSDPAQEQRARNLSLELRCLVCQNQSIDDSNAGLAKDLRVLVRERIEAGDSDEAVKSYLVARYGEFVLFKPTFSTHNFLLWTLPFLGLAMGMFLAFRRRKTLQVHGLSEEEQRRLKDILDTPLQTPPKN
jgi:cytochrome c-type biogenesis protein CcmH